MPLPPSILLYPIGDKESFMSLHRTRKLFLSIFSVLLLLGCQVQTIGGPLLNPPTATQISTATLPPTLTATVTQIPTATETLAPTFTPTPTARARRVVILSIDGLRPDAI